MASLWIRRGLTGVAFLALVGSALFVLGLWGSRLSLERARQDLAEGRLSAAISRLNWLARFAPADPEVQFSLGLAYRAAGDTAAAVVAWGRIPPGTPWSNQAALRRATILIAETGRLREAESLLRPLVRGQSAESAAARQELIRLYYWQGRRREIQALLEDHWDRGDRRGALLRELWRLDASPPSVGLITEALQKAGGHGDDDAGVWLGWADLALRSGRYAEAFGWIERCLRHDPSDPAAWRAQLEWAIGSGDEDAARTAVHRLRHLDPSALSPAEILRLRAWFASRRGDRVVEQAALEALLETDPAAVAVLERLAVLALEAGQNDRAASYRRRKAEIDDLIEEYRRWIEGGPSGEDLERLGFLAERLGRWFEARGWYTLALLRRPAQTELRATVERLEGQLRAVRGGSDGKVDLDTWLAKLERPSPSSCRGVEAWAGPIPAARFRDAAAGAGLCFAHQAGRSGDHHLPETMSGGVALLDFDGDGWLDLYVVQGGRFPPSSADPDASNGDRLFRNRGDGTFEDVSTLLGIDRLPAGYGHGVAVGDYDNDGDPDLLVTRWRSYLLLRNDRVRFVDVTAQAGLGGDRDWPTSAAFADLDGDGDLDLYVCHYLAWDEAHPPRCPTGGGSDGYCDPRRFPALPDQLFRNDGGRFVNITQAAGIDDPNGRGLGVVAADLDGDGLTDLFVANDTTADYFWRNLGALKFEEAGLLAGVAGNAAGGFQAGMGTACGDLDGDGLPDLVVTNFYGESTTFFRNLGQGLFTDQTTAIGLAAASRFLLGFGVALADFNNDGRLDLITANGHVNDARPDIPFAMPPQLLLGDGRGLRDASAESGPPFREPALGRGLAAGDLDHDGRIDVVLLCQDAPLRYLHNESPRGNFIAFLLEGSKSNRDALGARVSISAMGRRQTAWRVGGGSYQSASSPAVHFGLGGADRVEELEVAWPSGHIDRFQNIQANRGYRIREGESELALWPSPRSSPRPGLRAAPTSPTLSPEQAAD